MNEKDKIRNELTFPRRHLMWLVLIVAIASAAVGGVVSFLLMARSVQAQQPSAVVSGEIIVPPQGLLFKSTEGKTLAKLAADQMGVSFTIYNSEGTPAVGAYGMKGGGSLNVFDKRGSQSLSLLGQDGGGILNLLSGTHGKRVVEIAAGRNGGNVTVNNNTGEPAITIKAGPLGKKAGGSIGVYSGDSNQVVWEAPD